VRANEVRLQNIVDRVHQYRGDEADAARCLFYLMRGREPREDDLQWPPLIEKLESILAEKLVLLEIEPKHGATAVILAETVNLMSIDD